MKKIYSLLLVLTMIFSLCACGDTKDESNTATEPTTQENTAAQPESGNDTKEPAPAEKVDIPQIEVELDNENTIVVEGQEYALPMNLKNFLDTGWNSAYGHMEETIGADKALKYPSFSFEKNGEKKISGIGAFNPTDKDITIEQAILFSLKLVGVPEDDMHTQCSFTLPGGITEKSTYEDVCAVYGTKNESEYFRVSDDYESKSKDAETFEKYGFTMIFTSKDATVVPYNYYFGFNADKTIKYVEVDSADFKSAASAAFGK